MVTIRREMKRHGGFIVTRGFTESFALAEMTLDQAACFGKLPIIRFTGEPFAVVIAPGYTQIHVAESRKKMVNESLMLRHLLSQRAFDSCACLAATFASDFT